MSARRLTILGGSSPSTIALLMLLPVAGARLASLSGRTADSPRGVAGVGRRIMSGAGGSVRWTADLADALDGANFVVHQIRYGGLAGRANDESLAAAIGLPADETLGPSGLQSAIRMAPELL